MQKAADCLLACLLACSLHGDARARGEHSVIFYLATRHKATEPLWPGSCPPLLLGCVM